MEKSNIYNRDCFNEIIIEEIKSKKPNVGLLNPPYQSDKKIDTDELKFVLNNLECLEKGGTCVAIIPTPKVLAQSGKVLEFKKQILKNHTLEAVLSMPNELFHNSKTTVITSVLVIKAHKPHPDNKETFLGFYKDDGFVVRKHVGRYDKNMKWDEIKENWVNHFVNRKDTKISTNVRLKAEDEWCAEKFLPTNYEDLTDEDFIDEIKKYASYKIFNS